MKDQNKPMTLEDFEELWGAMTRSEFEKEYLNEWKDQPWPYTVYIVAGDYQQARFLVRANQIPKDKWKYVGEYWDLQGAQGQVVFYGNWYQRSDARRIADEVNHLIASKRLEEIKLSDEPKTDR